VEIRDIKLTDGGFRSVLDLADIDILLTFLNNQVSIKSFKGKVVFLEGTTFPRFKLTEYSKKNNKIQRTSRESLADALVLDIDALRQSLEEFKDSQHHYYRIRRYTKVSSDPDIYSETRTHNTTPVPTDFNGVIWRFFSNHAANTQIEALIHIYNNYPNIKLIAVQDLNQEVSTNYEPIDGNWAERLDSLLSSPDQAAVKLGMTYLTNANFEDSLLYSWVLLNKNYYNITKNHYFNSTNFRTFLQQLGKIGVYSYANLPIGSVIKEFLKLKNKKILKSSLPFLKEQVEKEIQKAHNFEVSGYKLKNYEVELNINPEDIIDDENIEDITEETTTEDNSDKYILLND